MINPDNTGTNAITISAIGVGRALYPPAASQTTLVDEVKRLTTFSGAVVADDVIHLTIRDETNDVYALGEIGLYTDTGVLWAVYSQPDLILEKSSGSMMLLSVDAKITTVAAENIHFGNAEFMLPPGTETVLGVLKLATKPEAEAGTDHTKAMTPLRTRQAIEKFRPFGSTAATVCEGNDSRLSDAREWTAATATQAEAEAGTATTRRAWTAQRVWQAVKAALPFGTIAGTVCQGNDSRLSDAREWTGGTVSQAEAETGTATTRRAWTAQRVWQAAKAALPFGTTAGTVCQGNDSRLTDAREWTAAIVTQAEAEAGTATTARKWTAQRVAQAIVAIRPFGNAAGTVCQGNDSRLSDAREWTADTVSQTEAQTGTATTRRAWTAQRVAQAIAAIRPFGTAAGTVCQGNDSRLSDAREWTAATVSQAEAQAGTATTERKWTAQRVRQAIEACYYYLVNNSTQTITRQAPVTHISVYTSSTIVKTITDSSFNVGDRLLIHKHYATGQLTINASLQMRLGRVVDTSHFFPSGCIGSLELIKTSSYWLATATIYEVL